jgi:hypothetical protein
VIVSTLWKICLVLVITATLAACGGVGGGGGCGGGAGGGSGGNPGAGSGGGGNDGGGGSDGGGDDTAGSGADVDQFMSSLKTWDEFAPPAFDEEDEGVERVDPDVDPVVEDVTDPNNNLKVCTTERVDFFETPEEYVMFTPPTNILYPGAMVVGKSLRDGATAGDILPINVQERTEVEVSIADCAIPNNSRRVPPTLAAVNSAVAEILFEAETLGADCVSPRGSLRVETYRNEEQRALKAGFSGRYFGFSGSASGSYSKDRIENSVAAVFRESLYSVDISAPQTPRGWFTEDFTSEKLQEQIDQDTMGEGNVPAYVARVTYGRIMTATLTSSFSEEDMRAAMEFKYANPTSEVSGDAAARSQTVREQSRYTLSYLGGSAEATAAMLRSNDWTQYFGVPATAGDAVPISFELRSVSDNRSAVVQELTSYDRTTCFDRVGDDATFTFAAEQTFVPSFSSPGQRVAVGDIDGENGDDIVWAASSVTSRGEFVVALSNGDGTFQALELGEHAAANGQSGDFDLLLTDVDADGRDDILLNVRRTGGAGNANLVYVAFLKEAGFVYSAPQVLSTAGDWDSYAVYRANADGARGGDLLFNNTPRSTTTNSTYLAFAADTTASGFDLETDQLFTLSPALNHPAGNFSGYEYTHVADFNGDGIDDVIWQNIDADGNSYYAALGTGSRLDFRPFHRFGSTWASYEVLVGDADADGTADLVEPRVRSRWSSFGIYIGEGSGVAVGGSGDVIDPHTFKLRNRDPEDVAIRDLFPTDVGADGLTIDPPDFHLADVNGDGTKDLIINDKGKRSALTNVVAVGLGLPGGSEYTFTRVSQSLAPAIDWSTYSLVVGDFNGDDREDVAWISSAAVNSVYAGLSR